MPSEVATSEPDPFIGEMIDGRYRVTQRLGSGGMGVVYLAEHAQLGRAMVVKRLRPELVASESTRERFLREAQSASRIQHPHVIAVSDYGVHPQHGAYYVMELLVGIDLGALLAQQGALPVERAMAIVAQAAEALAAAHVASIVHRDLKPENIFLSSRDGQPDFVKVLDFGLARIMDANRKLTETGQVIGTPRYMAPEQCRGEKVDARADVYSLALILHEALTGRQPYKGLSTYEILGKKMFEHVEAPSAMSPPVHVPPPLEAFLMRCLSREAALRPVDGARMADELHAVRGRLGLPPGPFAHLAQGVRQSVPTAAVAGADAPLAAAARTRSPLPMLLLGIVAGAFLVAVTAGLAGWILLVRTDPVPSPAPAPPEVAVPAPAPAEAPPPAAPTPAPAPRRHVQIVSDPPGAEVIVDGAQIGTTPIEVEVPTQIADGQVVELRLRGYASRQITIVEDVPRAHVSLFADE